MSRQKIISILGCGWLGLPLARHLIAQGYKIKGSTTSEQKIPLLRDFSIKPYLLKITETIMGNFESFVRDAEVLIINFPPKRVPDIQALYPHQMGLVLRNLPRDQKTIFISSTSVYQNNNSIVTEDIDPEPDKESGKAIVAAEKLLQQHLNGNLSILRFAGLIGDDRLPGRFLANKKDLENGNAPVNVIHQDDCIGLIRQIIEQEKWGETFNGCADEHPLRKVYYTRAAEKIGLVPPTFKAGEASEYKVVSNQKSKEDLAYRYQYPDPLEML